MARYLSEEEMLADGIRIEHDIARSRFVVLVDQKAFGEVEPREIGEAHYTLLGENGIDFDHTLVLPEFRGTGISGLLAAHALQHEIVAGRNVQASCWFIEEYLAKHPELLGARA